MKAYTLWVWLDWTVEAGSTQQKKPVVCWKAECLLSGGMRVLLDLGKSLVPDPSEKGFCHCRHVHLRTLPCP